MSKAKKKAEKKTPLSKHTKRVLKDKQTPVKVLKTYKAKNKKPIVYKSDKNKQKKQILIKNLKNALSVTESCKNSDISRDTFYEWVKTDVLFANQVESAKLSRCGVLEDSMFETAQKGNPLMQIFLACNWMPHKYRNVNKVEHTGEIPVNISLETVPTKELENRLAEIEKLLKRDKK